MKTVLTIAGSDPFGGAGMQADIKTMTAHGVYAITAVTLISAQNSIGFYGVQETKPEFLEMQIDYLFKDVIPDATKTGMLLSRELIEMTAKKLKEYKPQNLIIDPVIVSHKKIKLINDDAIETLLKELIPLADLITPNKEETEIISGMQINNEEDMEIAAKKIHKKYGCNVITKSGVEGDNANDYLYTKNGGYWLYGEKINTKNVRGTGDALSSAIASNLAKNYDIVNACEAAKRYVTKALKSNIQIGNGKGPIDSSFDIKGEY
ncbi:MAG: bifunctional hydroxymethylpyrimidine kinase/phosphomethylpyrimidine kinase [Helcococcus sp.]|nr:bifunctional hydroxymethylpyrimidine kinase/phosphomethylpyrimidine kinase [Helcococcus sp.]